MTEHPCKHDDFTPPPLDCSGGYEKPKPGDLWKCMKCQAWWVLNKRWGDRQPQWEMVTPDHLLAWLKTRKDKLAYPRLAYMMVMERWVRVPTEKGHRNIEYVDALVGIKQYESAHGVKLLP